MKTKYHIIQSMEEVDLLNAARKPVIVHMTGRQMQNLFIIRLLKPLFYLFLSNRDSDVQFLPNILKHQKTLNGRKLS